MFSSCRPPKFEVVPEYVELAGRKLFLASKAVVEEHGFRDLQLIAKFKQKLEVTHGALLGAGDTKARLKGFPEGKPLGAGSIGTNEEFALHHGSLEDWVQAYLEYGGKTDYGHLTLAGTESPACLKEVKGVPDGRLFAYVEHTEEDDPPNQGYIVAVSAAATVDTGRGFVLFHSGDCYHGELRGGKPHGQGTYSYAASGNRYVGQYCDGQRHGRGTWTWGNDGSSCEAFYESGELGRRRPARTQRR